MSVALRYAARSHLGLGTKSRNEDSAYAGPELLVLCDGMGGHAAGDVASSMVVGELVHLDGESHGADDMLTILEQAVAAANDQLAAVGDQTDALEGMGTTCIAMLRSGTKLAVANIGDSRAYLRRGNRVTQITKDHSFVQKLLDEGRITPEEAVHHPQRSLITRVLTGRPEDHPDLSMRELRVGDRLLLCSDGLTDYVAEETVADLLRTTAPPGEVADQLIAIALRASARDNVSVIVADVVPAGEGATKPQVVGAAEERRRGAALAPMSPAEKAAALTREINGPDDPAPELAEEGGSSRAGAWARGLLVALAVVLVTAGGGYATYDWSQRQYFVGEHAGIVTIFRGVSQDLGPITLSQPEEQTGLEVSLLPTFYQSRVRSAVAADDREDAEAIVEELRALALPRCADLLTPVGDATAATAEPPPSDQAGSTTEPSPPPAAIPPDDGSTTTALPSADDSLTTTEAPDGFAATTESPTTTSATAVVPVPPADDVAATSGPAGPVGAPAVQEECVP